MILLIVASMATPTIAWSYDDEPTDDELVTWWSGMTTEDRLGQLRNLDRYEHELPDVTFPEFDVIVTGDEIIMRPRAPLTIWLVDIGWTIQGPEHRAAYEPEETDVFGIAATWFGLGILAGFAVSLIIP